MRIVYYKASFSKECSCQLSCDKDDHCTFLSHTKNSRARNYKSLLLSHMATSEAYYYLFLASNISLNGGQLKTCNK